MLKSFTKHSLAAMALAMLAPAAAQAGLYTCGGFNNWDINNCLEFNEDSSNPNLYTLTLDFSRNRSFKISTVNPADHPDMEPWPVFDSGALTCHSPQLGTVNILERGLDNIESPVDYAVTVKVDLGDMTIVFGDAEPQTAWSQTLPLMVINTEDNKPITSKEDYLTATYYIETFGLPGYEAFGTPQEPLVTQIKGRGNWTWIGFDKKPYRLKLDKKQPLLGMTSSKHWALLAHADDSRGFLRNPVGFRLSEMLDMPWTSAQQPVEVVLNGEYIGLYFLTETIRVDKTRVNINEQKDLVTDPAEVTGGWLVEIDNYDSDPHVTIAEGGDNDYDIWFTYKTPELLSAEQDLYLTEQMSTLNDLIYGDTNSPALWSHLDMDQLARYYIVQEIVDNYESFHGSCYLYKQLGADELWHFGPVWDFGSALWGNKEQYIYQGRFHHQVWIGQICQFPAFMDCVKRIWRQFNDEKYEQIYTYVDDFADKIATACRFDARRWPQYGNANEQAKAREVKEFLQNSRTWLAEQWGASSGVENAQVAAPAVTPVEGGIMVTASADTTLQIATPSGLVRTYNVKAGTTRLSLPAGFYIAAGRKLAVH